MRQTGTNRGLVVGLITVGSVALIVTVACVWTLRNPRIEPSNGDEPASAPAQNAENVPQSHEAKVRSEPSCPQPERLEGRPNPGGQVSPKGPYEPVDLFLDVSGVERYALVYPGRHSLTEPSPLVLFFHGYGGKAERAQERHRLHKEWPEATVVYPQGLPVAASHDKSIVRPGWQFRVEHLDDRDIRFVDALVAEIAAQYQVDSERIFAAGYSNGAKFTFTLLTARPSLFAAFAPVGHHGGAASNATSPQPVLYVMGRQDPAYERKWAHRTMSRLLKLNRCNGEKYEEWAPGCRRYGPDAGGEPLLYYVHDGGHVWTDQITNYIVRFFKDPYAEANPPKEEARQ